MLRGFWLVAGLVVAGCGASEGATDATVAATCPTEAGATGADPVENPVCEAGRTESCPCAGMGDGVQTCAANGSRWEVCICPETKPEESNPSLVCKFLNDGPPEECPGPKSAVWGTCPPSITQNGYCIVSASGARFCCPP